VLVSTATAIALIAPPAISPELYRTPGRNGSSSAAAAFGFAHATDQRTDQERRSRRERQVHPDCERERAHPTSSDDERDNDADEQQGPAHPVVEQAIHQQGHDLRLRGRQLGRSDPLRLIQPHQGESDDQHRRQNADQQSELLQPGGGTDEIAGLEVLGRGPRVGGRNADDSPYTDGDDLITPPRPPASTNRRHVSITTAIVIPEIGLADEPMRPVMRADTTTKKESEHGDQEDGDRVARTVWGNLPGEQPVQTGPAS